MSGHCSTAGCMQGLTCHPDVLQLRHQLAVEAAHGVASQEPRPLGRQQLVNPECKEVFLEDDEAKFECL